MRIKINNTWKTRVEISLPGEGADQFIEAHFVAEFRELSLSEMRKIEKERRVAGRTLDAALSADEPDAEEIERLEDELARADQQLLERVLVGVHGIELEKADGTVMGSSELLAYAKDHTSFMLPIVSAFSERVQKAASKNSKRSGAN